MLRACRIHLYWTCKENANPTTNTSDPFWLLYVPAWGHRPRWGRSWPSWWRQWCRWWCPSPCTPSHTHLNIQKMATVLITILNCGSQKGGNWMDKIMYTVRKCKCWRYCLARCNEIFAFFPLFDETLRHIELCNNVIRHIQRNPPKHFFNTVVMYSLKSGSTRKDSYFFKLKFIIATWLIFFASLLIPYNTTQWTLACK